MAALPGQPLRSFLGRSCFASACRVFTLFSIALVCRYLFLTRDAGRQDDMFVVRHVVQPLAGLIAPDTPPRITTNPDHHGPTRPNIQQPAYPRPITRSESSGFRIILAWSVTSI